MKRLACWMWMVVLAAPAAFATERNLEEDRSAEAALLTWSDPAMWQVGLVYTRVSRPVELESGAEWNLAGDIGDAEIGVSPWPWLLIYGQVGGSKARLDGAQREEPSVGAGGVLGARVNLWQLHEGVQATAWRVTLQVAGQHAYRTTDDDGDGDIQWGETLVLLPLDYHLSFARTFRNSYMAEFHSVGAYVGPAYSKIDGTWTRAGAERDFEEADSFGVVAGVDLWLLENLSFGARADWFEHTTAQLSVRYRF